MKIVADDKIPFLRGVLEPFADIVYVPGKQINRDMLRDVDALIIRTRTLCNEALLRDTPVKFIGTATIGYDHIDAAWCESQGIVWKNAPGCNAASVNQYIASTLFNLGSQVGFSLQDRVLGVIGVGNVGSRVVFTAEMLGMRVYLCDPPRVRETGACGFISLDGILRECDILTFHVPLNNTGQDRTRHMINDELLSSVNDGTIIINTSRGEVADGHALKNAIKKGKLGGLVLDVWENEPDIDRELLSLCNQATPHIAGYSVDGKAKGTSMIIQELSHHFDMGIEDWEPENLPQPEEPHIRLNCEGLTTEQALRSVILHTYHADEDDKRLREHIGDFEKLRGDYPPRREFKAYSLELVNSDMDLRKRCRKLGFKVL